MGTGVEIMEKIKETKIRINEADLNRLKCLTGATTMNGAVDIAIQYTLDSYRKDIDFDLLNFVERVVKERMQQYTQELFTRIDAVQQEFEQLYIIEAEVTEAINDLVFAIQQKQRPQK
ncbi:hypothetical protein PT179_07835 [Erysipelothrix rhusiopathiae]|uniref:hypothetical protein n=1 Tax=Erysipelothrix rhusiopathiae TaxID=1648 RepID=UPI0023AFA8B9|nr:hypothetical protein [Erysipelothrix rhusiopathiae]MDE8055290.1 hypothetical protein [Erysipelothrix rhusiopathiae]MDE8061320.1 hypothetical protein [Erysipelothrix rhusiopathiae]MDE8092960.1 hypothetical protein [Erysipelothrix rhusiopathiae]MDE8098028.1 hypothetical protein [Erysipelothrix rhusiopathiae]